MNKRLVFEVDFRNRTFKNSVDGSLPTISGTPELKRGDKGYGLSGSTDSDGLVYGSVIPSGAYSIVMWGDIPESTLSAIILDFRDSGGTGYFWVDAGGVFAGSSGTFYVNNAVSTTITGQMSHIVATGITIEASSVFANIRTATYSGGLENSNTPYFAIYEGTLTSAERDELYQDFLRAGMATSTPTVIRPKIEVRGDEESLGAEIVTNGDFSSWNHLGVPTGWDTSSTAVVEQEPHPSGVGYLPKVYATGASGGHIRQSLVVASGNSYKLSFCYKTTGGQSQVLRLYDATNATYFVFTTLPASLDWTVYTTTIDIPSTCTAINIYHGSDSAGDTDHANFMLYYSLERIQKTVLAYDFQNWRGGQVIDLSGNGNNYPTPPVQSCEGGVSVTKETDTSAPYIELEYPVEFSNEILIHPLDTGFTHVCFASPGWSDAFIRLNLSSNIQVQYVDTGGAYASFVVADASAELQHIVVTASASSLKVYRNGVLAFTGNPPRHSTGLKRMYILGGSGGVVASSKVVYKFFKIHNYLLTPDQIKAKYNTIANTLDMQCLSQNLLPNSSRVYVAGERMEM